MYEIPGITAADLRGTNRIEPSNPLLPFESPGRKGETISTTRNLSVRPGALIEFAGDGVDWTITNSDDPIPSPIGPGDFWAAPSSGLITLTAGSGSLKVWEWSYEMGKIRAQSAGAKAISAAAQQPNKTQVFEVGITGANPQTFNPPAGSLSVDITYDKDNAANFGVSDSDVNGERVQVGPTAPLSTVTFDGANPILFRGTLGDTAIFICHVRA